MDRPCLDRSSFNVWGLGITQRPLIIIILYCVIVVIRHYQQHHDPFYAHSPLLRDWGWHRTTVYYFVLVRISVLSCCYSSSLHVTDLPLRVIVLSAQSGKLSGYLLFMLSSAEAASSEVLTLQCYCLSHGHCLWSGSSSRSGSGSWLLFLVMLVMLVVLW